MIHKWDELVTQVEVSRGIRLCNDADRGDLRGVLQAPEQRVHSQQPCDRRRSGRRRASRPRRGRLRTRSDCAYRGTSTEHAIRLAPDQACRAGPETRRTAWMTEIRGAGVPPGRVRERRCRRDRTGCPASSLRSPRPSAVSGPNGRDLQTPSRREVPLRVRFPDPRGAQAGTAMSFSDPIIQSFGCSSTRVTNAFSVLARFENSATVYTVGLIFRPVTPRWPGSVSDGRSFAPRSAASL
jgi:hypothetical protein